MINRRDMKVNIFKKFVPVLSCIAAGLMPVISCTEVEPIEMQVGGVEKDYASIRAFKATEHPLSLTWISSWRADGSMDSYLSALPDSLDMVVVESGYGDLSVAQLADLSSVRETRGTKVIVSLDMDAVAATYGEDILQAEIDGENNAYEAAEAENPDGVPTDEEIEAAVAIETAKVQDDYSARVTALVDGILAEVEKYSYDGILLRVNSITDQFFRELVDGTLDRLDGKGLFILVKTSNPSSGEFQDRLVDGRPLYEIVGEDLLFERTFERGVEDFTYACGTGTGSVVTVLTLQGKVSGHGVQVDMTGGRLVIDAERIHSRIASLYLTGPTNVVCRGQVTDEDLTI